ncbi:MAG: hypothetical protein ABF629_09350 [Sporolactobacillus sp.]
MNLFDLISILFDFLFAPQVRIQSNLEYLEGEEWFKRQYDRKILSDPKFRRFIKKYNLKKVFQNDEQKEVFKAELEKWVEKHSR